MFYELYTHQPITDGLEIALPYPSAGSVAVQQQVLLELGLSPLWLALPQRSILAPLAEIPILSLVMRLFQSRGRIENAADIAVFVEPIEMEDVLITHLKIIRNQRWDMVKAIH